MKCLCCSKPFDDKATAQELKCGWHNKCVKRFFATKELPDIDISSEVIEQLAAQSTSKGLTVTGVQKKLSLYLSNNKNEKPRLTLVNYPTGYILKPQTRDYACLPEAEYFVMKAAQLTGIKTVPFALIKAGDSFAYITKRIDRTQKGKLAMEDFCQLDGRLVEDKYKGSYERCGNVISKFSSMQKLDKTELFIRIVFSFIIGNSDMHLKNFSLIETDVNSQNYVLSDAYDLLPVNIVNPYDDEETALTLNGKKHNIRRKDFLKLAESYEIDERIATKLINNIIAKKDLYIDECINSYLSDELKKRTIDLIEQRINQIS